MKIQKMARNQLARIPKLGRSLQGSVSIILKHPREIILENTTVSFASIVGGILSIIAPDDSTKMAIFGLSVAIVAIGVVIETRRRFIYTQKSLPIPIVINISSSANELDALNSLFTLIQQKPAFSNYQKNLEKYLGISSNDLTFKFNGEITEKEKLKDFLKIVRHDLGKIKQKTPQNSQFDLVYVGPISIAFLVGSMLARENVKIMQPDKSPDVYACVLNKNQRDDSSNKQEIAQFEKFKVTECLRTPSSRSEKATVIIETGFRIDIDDSSIQIYGDVILLKKIGSNQISFEEDWSQYCREIYYVINEKHKQYKEIKLVYTMPVSLAIGVGMEVQHFINIQLTQYDSEKRTYLDIIKINEVTYHY